MELSTERLRLVPLRPDHADGLLALFRDPHVRRFLLDDALVGRDWVLAEIRTSEDRFAGGGLGLWAATRVGAEGLAGVVGFRAFPAVLGPELLYALAPRLVGQGLATEMAGRVVDLALRAHGFGVVRASTDERNVASVRVLRRLGFWLVRAVDGPRWRRLHFAVTSQGWSGPDGGRALPASGGTH